MHNHSNPSYTLHSNLSYTLQSNQFPFKYKPPSVEALGGNKGRNPILLKSYVFIWMWIYSEYSFGKWWKWTSCLVGSNRTHFLPETNVNMINIAIKHIPTFLVPQSIILVLKLIVGFTATFLAQLICIWILFWQTCNYKNTNKKMHNTQIQHDEVPERLNLWHIFEMKIVWGYQKWYSHE